MIVKSLMILLDYNKVAEGTIIVVMELVVAKNIREVVST